MRYLQYEIDGVIKTTPIIINVVETYKILKSREEMSKLSPILKPESYSNFKVVREV